MSFTAEFMTHESEFIAFVDLEGKFFILHTFSVQIRDASNKKSSGIRSKIDIKSPVLTTKLTSMFMLKNQKVAIVRSTLDYVIPKVNRDKVTLNGKLNVANTKSLSAAKGNM